MVCRVLCPRRRSGRRKSPTVFWICPRCSLLRSACPQAGSALWAGSCFFWFRLRSRWRNPQPCRRGGRVQAGHATISTGGGQMRIDQPSDHAVIDWQSFSVGRGGSVTFAMPGTGSAMLNRVSGHETSVIAGTVAGDSVTWSRDWPRGAMPADRAMRFRGRPAVGCQTM